MSSTTERRARFRALHESATFVIPNPWDAGSARLLESLGFKALASTSSGYAWSTGRRDNHITLDDALTHLRTLADAVDLPIHADFEGGFAIRPEHVASNVVLAAETGISGLSIEDSTGDPNHPLFDFALAVERVSAAKRALDALAPDVMLVARTEGFITGRPDIDETLRRLRAFSDAGADCLYAPGIRTREHIAAVVQEGGQHRLGRPAQGRSDGPVRPDHECEGPAGQTSSAEPPRVAGILTQPVTAG